MFVLTLHGSFAHESLDFGSGIGTESSIAVSVAELQGFMPKTDEGQR